MYAKFANENGTKGDVVAIDEKKTCKILKRPLATIRNKDVSTSHFDNCLEVADMSPFHDKDATTSKKKNRNVSVLLYQRF